MRRNNTLAVYYFPNYHTDARNEAVHGKGWTEWDLVKCAVPRFPGHEQPVVPLWGYGDEANPDVMAQKIDAAADSGIDAFVFDWYWYDGPFLQRALDEGFLGAPNRKKLKFALMWANHSWRNIHPCGRSPGKHPGALSVVGHAGIGRIRLGLRDRSLPDQNRILARRRRAVFHDLHGDPVHRTDGRTRRHGGSSRTLPEQGQESRTARCSHRRTMVRQPRSGVFLPGIAGGLVSPRRIFELHKLSRTDISILPRHISLRRRPHRS